MHKAIQVSCIIDKLPLSWKDFKHTLKHLKEELTLVELGSHLHIEKSLRAQASDKPKGNNVVDRSWFKTYESLNDGSILHMGNESTALVHGRGCVDLRLNIVNDNIASAYMSISKLNDSILWHARLGHVHFKMMQDMSKGGLIPAFDMDTEKWNKKYFVTFIDDALRFCYVYLLHTKDEALDKFKVYKIKVELQQESLIKRFRTYKGILINSINESKDAIFDENRFLSVPKPSQRSLKDGTEDIGGSVVANLLVANGSSKKLKVDETIKKFKVRLVIQGFRQKSRIDYFDTYAPVARISTIRLLIVIELIHDLIIYQMGVKTAFLNGELEEKVDLTKGFLSSRFSMKDMGKDDVIFVSTPMDTSEKPMTNNGYTVSQLEYSMMTGCLMYVITCIRPDIAFTVGKLSSDTEYNSSTSGWVFLLGGGVISWSSKKQTCISGSTMESEFLALAAAGKKVEWLKNLLLKIILWSKPIAPISIRCDSATTLGNAYS
nr:hypothetical protein [Tanacetum cinerariifolium]